MKKVNDRERIIIRTSEILDECFKKFYEIYEGPDYNDAENKQPKQFSWLSIAVNSDHFATENSGSIKYKDAQEMRQNICLWAIHMLPDKLLRQYLDGKISNITLRIGPELLSGSNLNDDNGITLDV